jgi:hypothetical protein
MGPRHSARAFFISGTAPMDIELLIRAAKAMVEVAGFAYLGQAIVALFAGARRDTNVVYQIFKIVTSPVTRATRFVTPKFMPDRHIPFVAFGLLLWAWMLLLVMLARLKGGA